MLTAAIALFRSLTPRAWLVIAVLGAVVALLAYCAADARRDAREARSRQAAGQTFAEGRTGAAQDASAIRDRADDRNDEISNAVKEGTADVRQAPDRSAANLAARRGVCRVNPSAGPDCRMLLADPGRVD